MLVRTVLFGYLLYDDPAPDLPRRTPGRLQHYRRDRADAGPHPQRRTPLIAADPHPPTCHRCGPSPHGRWTASIGQRVLAANGVCPVSGGRYGDDEVGQRPGSAHGLLTVQCLSDDVGVSGVLRGFGDDVQEHPAHRANSRPARTTAPAATDATSQVQCRHQFIGLGRDLLVHVVNQPSRDSSSSGAEVVDPVQRFALPWPARRRHRRTASSLFDVGHA